MNRDIIIAGPQCSGKTSLAKVFTMYLNPSEILELTPNLNRFLGGVNPDNVVRVIVMDEMKDLSEIIKHHQYLSHLYRGMENLPGMIFITQDVDGVNADKEELKNVFNLHYTESLDSFQLKED